MKNRKLAQNYNRAEINIVNIDQQSITPTTSKGNRRSIHKKCVNYIKSSQSQQDVIDLSSQSSHDDEEEDDCYSPFDSSGNKQMKVIKGGRKTRGKELAKQHHFTLLKQPQQRDREKEISKTNKKKNIIFMESDSESNSQQQDKNNKKSSQYSSHSEISDHYNDNQDVEDQKNGNEMIEQNSNMSDARNQLLVGEWSNSQQSISQEDEKLIKKQYELKQYIPPKCLAEQYIPILQPTPNQPKQSIQSSQIQPQRSKQKVQEVLDYAHYYPTYKQRRLFKYINAKIDLNVRYLHEIVYDCYIEGLISNELMINIKNMGLNNSLQFIQKYKQVKLSQFDFKKVKFTVLDHRRLCSLLKSKGQRQYTDECPIFFIPYELHLFMVELYKLDEESYQAICQTVDTSFHLTWWKTIGTQLQGNQPQQQPIKTPLPQQLKPQLRTNQRKKCKEKATAHTENKENSKMQEQQQCSISMEKIRNEQDSHQHQSSSSIRVKSRSEKPSKVDDSLLYSSQMFQTQKVLGSNSMFSIEENTHSLSDISDLLSEESSNWKNRKDSDDQSQSSQQQKQQLSSSKQLKQEQQMITKQKNVKRIQQPSKKMKKKTHSTKKKRGNSQKKGKSRKKVTNKQAVRNSEAKCKLKGKQE